ncbi:MAG: VCBS repeat-containing protein, partial [Myxococcota bacterium]|nr:VCBS repeat-containing protein [Myxococcota bacterium]
MVSRTMPYVPRYFATCLAVVLPSPACQEPPSPFAATEDAADEEGHWDEAEADEDRSLRDAADAWDGGEGEAEVFCGIAPAPLLPWNGAYTGSFRAPPERSTLRPRFRWRSVEGCGDVTYHLQVDDSCATPGFAACAFDSPEVDAAGLAGLDYQPESDLAIGTEPPVGRRYYWRVRACSEDACGPWSAVRYAEVGRVPNDWNGDGWSDVIVGVQHGEAPAGHGAVWVFFGGESVDPTAPDIIVGNPVLGLDTRFGCGLGTADFDADGFADLFVGAPARVDLDFVDGFKGEVTAYFGSARPDNAPDLVFRGHLAAQGFSCPLAPAGDVNGDGYADLIVGADRYHGGGYSIGRAYVYFGGERSEETPVVELVGELRNDYFGMSVAGCFDVNADGFADVVVGAGDSLEAAIMRAGRSYVYFGGEAFGPPADLVLDGENLGNMFGSVVRTTGDVNADGFGDFLVVAPGYEDDRGLPIDRTYLYLGAPEPDIIADVVMDGAPFAGMGHVAGAWDFDGDGFD